MSRIKVIHSTRAATRYFEGTHRRNQFLSFIHQTLFGRARRRHLPVLHERTRYVDNVYDFIFFSSPRIRILRERISRSTISSRGMVITSTAREQEALQNCERIIGIYRSVRNDEVKVKSKKCAITMSHAKEYFPGEFFDKFQVLSLAKYSDV